MTTSEHVIDPVCGMTIVKAEAPFSREHGGATYHLCSRECALRFDADADAFAALARSDVLEWDLEPHPPTRRGPDAHPEIQP